MNAPRLIGRVSSARPHVLLVTPPATPPWHNGSTLLARHLAASGRGFHYRLLGIRGQVSPQAACGWTFSWSVAGIELCSSMADALARRAELGVHAAAGGPAGSTCGSCFPISHAESSSESSAMGTDSD